MPSELSLPEQHPRLSTRPARFLTDRNALPAAFLLVVLASIGDAMTSTDTAFTLVYLLPIGIVSWSCKRSVALATIAVCVAVGAYLDVRGQREPVSWAFNLWNQSTEFGVYVAFSYTLHLLRKRLDAEVGLRMAALDQLRHADRLNTLGRLTSGMAHELGTPLNVISGRADLIVRGRTDLQGAKDSAAIIAAQADRMALLIRHLLAFARRGGTQTSEEDMLTLCQETADLLAPLAKPRGVDLVVRGASAVASVNRSEIQQVVSNLVANAIHAMPKGGPIEIALDTVHTRLQENADTTDRRYVLLRIKDEGAGIDPSVLPHIFDPFFTTKDVGEGTGLGLSIVFGIVRDHGGVIRVESKVGVGTTVLVFLPQYPP